MKSICFFNNKGGVGKTTLVCNVASYLSTHLKQRVLLVDADPQCNSTQLIVNEEKLADRYASEEGQGYYARKRPEDPSTLYDILEPIAKGESAITTDINPMAGINNRFGLDLLMGNPRVALLEDQLSQAWVNFGGGEIGGARKTNWNSQLLDLLRPRYDMVFFDVGPSLGALNRSVLVGVDYFVTPLGCDIFSIAGIDNLALWLGDWLKWYDRSLITCREKWGDFGTSVVREDTAHIARFVGYTVQQYITKLIRGERRATKAYEAILKRIPEAVFKELHPLVSPSLVESQLHLGDVPNMFSLVPLAQNANAPITALSSSDGLIGTQYSQKDSYVGFIKALAEKVLANTGGA